MSKNSTSAVKSSRKISRDHNSGNDHSGNDHSGNDSDHNAGRDLDAEIGLRLKRIRLHAGKTQADVAKALGISPQQYQKYEKGATKCAITTLFNVAAYYDLPVNAFLPGHDAEDPGFSEEAVSFATHTPKPSAPGDDAAFMAELLAIFIRIPTKARRRKMLDLLNTLFAADAED